MPDQPSPAQQIIGDFAPKLVELTCFADITRALARDNTLLTGSTPVGDRLVDLADITGPILCIVGDKDHICPPAAAEPVVELVGSEHTWSTLVNAELPPGDADGATRLTDEDLILFWQLLVIAGNETTRNSISGGVLALVEHREQAIRLYEQPDLMPSAVEEILRWVSPVNHFRRTATEDVELGGKQIRAGDKVVVYYASANRDEDVFTDPLTFDITCQPNPHLAFGAGPHFCLGAPLARLQLRTMLGELIPRYPRSKIVGPVERVPITFLAGIKSMPVQLVA